MSATKSKDFANTSKKEPLSTNKEETENLKPVNPIMYSQPTRNTKVDVMPSPQHALPESRLLADRERMKSCKLTEGDFDARPIIRPQIDYAKLHPAISSTKNPYRYPGDLNGWSTVSARSMTDAQKEEDLKTALNQARFIYNSWREQDRRDKMNGWRNKEIAQILAEDALGRHKGWSVACMEERSEQGAQALAEIIDWVFNVTKYWEFPGRDW